MSKEIHSEKLSLEEHQNILRNLEEARKRYLEKKKTLASIVMRNGEPTDALINELAHLESEFIRLKAEAIRSGAEDFYREPLTPLVPEEPKQEKK